MEGMWIIMKAVILAGGYGTRISEESYLKPKPMIEVGEKPILWHVMKVYSYYGINDFIICAGYKQHIIKQWFADYFIHNSDITFDFTNGKDVIIHNQYLEPWKVTVIDTGLNTMTGGRIKRIQEYVGEERFCMTYGDGVANVNISDVLKLHEKAGTIATLTTIRPEGRFGVLDIEDYLVKSFREKNQEDTGWINGGFMVLESEVFDYIKDDSTIFESEPLECLAKDGQLSCYKHHGFWKCMDTKKDQDQLEALWQSGQAPWKLW